MGSASEAAVVLSTLLGALCASAAGHQAAISGVSRGRGERIAMAADHRFKVAAERAIERRKRTALARQAKRLRQPTDGRRSRTNHGDHLGLPLDHDFCAPEGVSCFERLLRRYSPAGRKSDPVAGAEAASHAGAPPGARRVAERVDADEHRPRLNEGRRREHIDLRRRLRRQVVRSASQARTCPSASRSR